MSRIISTAEPFFLPGRKSACLLVHGFTGAPTEMRWLGDYLHQQGHTVLGVRLAGHGTHVKDMIRTRWQDWAASVEDGWHLLQETADQVFVIGLSMGGALALHHAANFPVAGVVAMSTPFEAPDKNLRNLPWLAYLYSKLVSQQRKSRGGWFDQQSAVGHIAYSKNPVRSAYELNTLLGITRPLLPTIQAPALLIHSKQDTYVQPYHAEKIYTQLGSPQKELVWIENSGHVVTRDAQRQTVFELCAAFIENVKRS